MTIARPLVVLVMSAVIGLGGVLLVRATVVAAGQKPAPIVKPYDPYT